ncbi:MAG: trypsin-like peptidase domain-containing protein [Clostridia bacterium]|nr:trypsin-like peptidase domain-containing protein [Clostridia bacterium]
MKKVLNIFIVILSIFLFVGCSAIDKISFFNSNDSEQNFDSKLIDTSNISSIQNLVATCKPAVVGIAALSGRYQSIGTGVCIKKGAYILTNNHVIENGNVINLYLSDGSTCNAKIIWTDASSDLAMLKASKDIPYLPLAKSGGYNSGDEVVAIGTPLDLAFKHSATMGIISATNRTISVDNSFGESTLYNLIQHDASINPGNSGGPLLNMRGEVIGINTVKVTDAEGMGFAIPVDIFQPVIEKISANGSYATTYLGVFGYDNELKNVGKIAKGYYVQSVAKDSPAQNADIKNGDIIVSLNGEIINSTKDLKIALYRHEVGDTVTLGLKNGEEVRYVSVKLKNHPYAYTAGRVIKQ